MHHTFRPYTRRLAPRERWMRLFARQVVVIEGNIGSGKTTLGQQLVRFAEEAGLPADFLAERFPEALLTQFITYGAEHPFERNVYAFPLQREILQCRIATAREAERLRDAGHFVVIDRSVIGDYVFAYVNHTLDNITSAEWVEYLALVEEADLLEPTALLFLDTTVQTCRTRIGRRARDAESKYTPEYLGLVQQTHVEVLRDVPYPCLTLPWDTDRSAASEVETQAMCTTVFKALGESLYVNRDKYRVRVSV
jgi:deoxyadenosine/deoxycytidine kinase